MHRAASATHAGQLEDSGGVFGLEGDQLRNERGLVLGREVMRGGLLAQAALDARRWGGYSLQQQEPARRRVRRLCR